MIPSSISARRASVFTAVALLANGIGEFRATAMLVAALLGGLTGDLLLAWRREDVGRHRVFVIAAVVPAVTWTAWFALAILPSVGHGGRPSCGRARSIAGFGLAHLMTGHLGPTRRLHDPACRGEPAARVRRRRGRAQPVRPLA